MKVKELINELQKHDPEARVYYSDWMGKGRNEILCAYSYKNNSDVILQDATQFDVHEELKEMLDYFCTENIDEVDAYTQMCDMGYTPDIVEEYYDEDVAKHMKEFCDEHGIDY